jgi:hypothetical protein
MTTNQQVKNAMANLEVAREKAECALILSGNLELITVVAELMRAYAVVLMLDAELLAK